MPKERAFRSIVGALAAVFVSGLFAPQAAGDPIDLRSPAEKCAKAKTTNQLREQENDRRRQVDPDAVLLPLVDVSACQKARPVPDVLCDRVEKEAKEDAKVSALTGSSDVDIAGTNHPYPNVKKLIDDRYTAKSIVDCLLSRSIEQSKVQNFSLETKQLKQRQWTDRYGGTGGSLAPTPRRDEIIPIK